jgi:hypothetical protein
MAVEGSEVKEGAGKKFVGLENFRILAINPNLAQLKAFGFNYDKEPEYTGKNSDGEEQIRVDFVLNNAPEEGETEIKGIASYYIVNGHKKSTTGKWQVCNELGQYAWLEDLGVAPSNMTWFNMEGVRKAFKGEELMMKMIRNYCNVMSGGRCSLDNPTALLSGNVTEISEYIEHYPNNKIKVLSVIKEVTKENEDGSSKTNHYSAFYTRHTERPYSSEFDRLRDDIEQWQANGGGANLIIPPFPYSLRVWNGVEPDGEPVASNEAKGKDTPW